MLIQRLMQTTPIEQPRQVVQGRVRTQPRIIRPACRHVLRLQQHPRGHFVPTVHPGDLQVGPAGTTKERDLALGDADGAREQLQRPLHLGGRFRVDELRQRLPQQIRVRAIKHCRESRVRAEQAAVRVQQRETERRTVKRRPKLQFGLPMDPHGTPGDAADRERREAEQDDQCESTRGVRRAPGLIHLRKAQGDSGHRDHRGYRADHAPPQRAVDQHGRSQLAALPAAPWKITVHPHQRASSTTTVHTPSQRSLRTSSVRASSTASKLSPAITT